MRPSARVVIPALVEGVAIAASLALASEFHFGSWEIPFATTNADIWRTLLFVSVTQACLYMADLYDLRLVSDRRTLITQIGKAFAWAALALATIYFWFPGTEIARGVVLNAFPFLLLIVSGWRLAFPFLSHHVGPRERLLLVGTNPAAVALARELHERRHDIGVEIVGFVDPDSSKVGTPVVNPGVIGTIEDIPSIVRARGVDRVVVSLIDARGKLPMEKLLEMKLDGVTFDHLPSVYEEYTGKIAVENLRPSWLIFSEGFAAGRALGLTKRALDVGISSAGILLGWPLFLLLALVVRLTSTGPVFYQQQRVGLRGRVFTVHKFRTMREDAEAETGPVWAAKDGDPRVTPVGRLLRRSRLDELPQLWNVLIGEMSFVGPRPERPEFVTELTKVIPYYGQRHIVRPGLTGWAQVRYTYGASQEDALQKLQFDLYYIKKLSLSLDLYIMFETVKTVLLRKGA
jgi:sugar transferase (PEP-CTERM system associated)